MLCCMVHPKRLLFAEEDARINERLGSRKRRVVFRAAVDAQLEQRRLACPTAFGSRRFNLK
jgi:hypothetical protein